MQEKLSSKLHSLNGILNEMLAAPEAESKPKREPNYKLGGSKPPMSKFTTALTKTQVREA